MAVKLLAINDVYNIREAKYIVDEENEKNLIPEEDKVQGTRVLVIKGSKEYRMDSNKNWVLIKGEGGDSSLPDVSSTDNGKVLGVVNGEWDKMTAPSGGDGDVFVISLLHTLDYEDPNNPVDVYTSDKTDEEIVSAFGDGKNVFVRYQFQDDTNIKYLRCSHCTYEPYENEGDVYVHAVFEDICDVEENFTMQSILIANHFLQYDCEIYDGETDHRWDYIDKSTVAQLYSKNNIIITSSGDISAQNNTYTPSIAYNQAKSYGDKLSIVVKNGSSATSAKLWAAVSTRVDSNGIYFDVPYTEVISNKTIDKVRSFQWTNAAILDLGTRQVSGDSFPTVTSSDNGKVLGVVNGAWDKMSAPGGGDDIFVISATINEGDYDPVTDTYPYVVTPDKTPEEVASAIRNGKCLIVNAYNTASNVSYIMSCITNNIVDGDNGYCRATAEFVASGRSILSVRQTRSLKQYTVSFEYQHPTNGSGSEPTVSWSFNEVTGFVNVNDKYYADIKISTEQITSSTTYTIESGTDQSVASQKARTGDLIITVYYGSYNTESKIYNVINCYTVPSTILNKKKIYFDVIDTLDTTTTQMKLHKLCWDGDDTITHVGSYSIPIPALPNVSSSDNGKVLGVVNGTWDKVTPSDGDAFVITLTKTVDTSDPENPVTTYTADKADEEILDAFANGKDISVYYISNPATPAYVECFRLVYFNYEEYEAYGNNPAGVYVDASFENVWGITKRDQEVRISNEEIRYYFDLYEGSTTPGSWSVYDDPISLQTAGKFNVKINASGDIANDNTTYSTTETYSKARSNITGLNIEVYQPGSTSYYGYKWEATDVSSTQYGILFNVHYMVTSGNTKKPMIRSFFWDNNGITSTGKVSAGGDAIPTVTTSDNGTVLQVNSSGEWAKGIKIQEHDYTVTYANGTTATLKNVEVM